MAQFTSESDYNENVDAAEQAMFTSSKDFSMPEDDPQLNTVRSQGRGQQMIDTAAYQQRRMNNAMKQAWYKLRGNDQEVKDLQKIIDNEDKIYEKYYRSEYNPHRTAAAVGNVAGAVTHPVSMVTMPLGGGSGLISRAGMQGLYGAGVEALTTPGGAGDRLLGAAGGFAGGALGSAGTDVAAKGYSGMVGKWFDDVAKKGDDLSKLHGLEPGVGQLREYSGRQMTSDQLKKRGANWPYVIEKHATHRQEVDARKLKAALGHNPDASVSKALPRVDAGQLSEELAKESEAIWKPFKQAARNTDQKVFPLKLWNSLQDVAQHNSKLLTDSSAIPDDAVRNQLIDLVTVNNPAKLPKYTPEEYSKIVGELSNAQHRLTVLSGGQTPTYDAASVGRITDAFASAKDDMADWGSRTVKGKKVNEKAYNHWQNALTDYQDKILSVKNNPVFQTSKTLNPKGRDLNKLLDTATDGGQHDLVRDLLKEYKGRGMDDAANRLDLLDINSLATSHGAAASPAVLGSLPVVPKTSDALSLLGDAYAGLANRPSVKGLYFGDPRIPDLDKMGIGKGALSSMMRRAPIAASREFGPEEATILKMLYELMPWAGDGEDPTQGNDPVVHGGMGAATQAGVAGR